MVNERKTQEWHDGQWMISDFDNTKNTVFTFHLLRQRSKLPIILVGNRQTKADDNDLRHI